MIGHQSSLYHRNHRGSMGVLMPAGILLCVLGLGAFAADVYHNITCRTELQNAADAGALAGARCLIKPDTYNDAQQHALQVAQANQADGRAVSNSSENTLITVNVYPGGDDEYGICEVNAEMQINNWIGPFFGRPTDTINCRARAAASRTVNQVAPNMLFPLAVSLDKAPTPPRTQGANPHDPNKKALKDLRPGDTLYIEINSQQWKNGAYTSFSHRNTNAKWLSDAFKMALGLIPPEPGYIPAVAIGDMLSVTNGVSAGTQLARGELNSALLDKAVLYLPVIEGGPPFTHPRECVGFIAVKVNSLKMGQAGGQVQSFECTLLTAPIKGKKGEIPDIPGNNEGHQALVELSPSSVRLISDSDV